MGARRKAASFNLSLMHRVTGKINKLLAKWAARIPYRRAATVMRARLPLRRSEISYGSVRRATIDTDRRIEARALDREKYA